MDGGGRGVARAAGPLLSFESLSVCPSGGSRVMETATSGGTPTLMGNQTPAFVSFEALQVDEGGGVRGGTAGASLITAFSEEEAARRGKCLSRALLQGGAERRRHQEQEGTAFSFSSSPGRPAADTSSSP